MAIEREAATTATGGDHDPPSPWLDARGAARRAKCSPRVIYDAVRRGKLKAARLSARRELRLHIDWIDAWITASADVVNPDAPGPRHATAGLGRP